MRIPVLLIVLLGVIPASSSDSKDLVSFACRFFNGMFHGECDKVEECLADQPITNSDDTTIASVVGESYQFTCKTGFTKLGSNGIISCVSDGQGGPDGTWQIAISTLCEAVECPADQPIPNSDDITIAGKFGESYPFTCKTGFTKLGSNGSISCVTVGQGGPDGKWEIDSPCEDCGYSLIRNFKGDLFEAYQSLNNVNQIGCDEACTNDNRCTFAEVKDSKCDKYEAPVVSYSEDVDVDQCQANCTQIEKCELFYHKSGGCYLFSIHFNDYYSINESKDFPEDVFGLKKPCP